MGFEHAIEVLEFPRLLEIIAETARTGAAREKLLSVSPFNNIEDARRREAIISECTSLLVRFNEPNLSLLQDVRAEISHIGKTDSILEPERLRKLADVVKLSEDIIIKRREWNEFPAIKELLSPLASTGNLHETIYHYITEEGKIDERQSNILREVRREKKSLYKQIDDRLKEYIHKPGYLKILQENLVTIKDGRFVLPVRQDKKQEIKGIIHGHSSTGMTVFIEPMDIVDLNNKLRELDIAEEEEIRRILLMLCDKVREKLDIVSTNTLILYELDFFSCCAFFSARFNCTEPEIVENGTLLLKSARHPLLTLEKEKVIPLNLSMPESVRTLIITGPNTGGKTVALKTIGLLSLMAICGLPIPASQGSRIPFFHDIVVDIGDEQSLESNLSTFASHLRHWKEAIELSTTGTLVLLDELGSSTDPEEGVPLARAIAEVLTEKGSLNFVTTHLGELKLLASQNTAIENAGMEFDEEAFLPTYHMKMGTPGSSWAIKIAEKSQFPEEVIKRAKNFLPKEKQSYDELIAKVKKLKSQLEKQGKKLQNSIAEAEDRRTILANLEEILSRKEKELSKQLDEFEEEKDKKLEQLLSEQKRRIEQMLRKTRGEPERIKTLLKTIGEKQKSVRKRIQKRRNRRSVTVKRGDAVRIKQLLSTGEVIAGPDKNNFYTVLIKGKKVKIKTGDIVDKLKIKQRIEKEILYEIPDVPDRVDVRGMTFEETRKLLDKLLDKAVIAGVSPIRIYHGVGRMRLDIKVREYLRQNPYVLRFETPSEEGETGITIVWVKGKKI